MCTFSFTLTHSLIALITHTHSILPSPPMKHTYTITEEGKKTENQRRRLHCLINVFLSFLFVFFTFLFCFLTSASILCQCMFVLICTLILAFFHCSLSADRDPYSSPFPISVAVLHRWLLVPFKKCDSKSLCA